MANLVSKATLVIFIGSLMLAGCIKSPDMPNTAAPDLGEKPIAEFSAEPTGKFTATSAATNTKPLEGVAQCLQTRTDEQNDLTKIYKVGQKFINKFRMVEPTANKTSTLLITKNVTNVSSESLEVHSVLIMGSVNVESDEICTKFKSSPGTHTFTLSCKNKKQDSTTPQPTTKFESCKIESDGNKTDTYVEGKFTLASGKQVSAIKHVAKTEGTFKCRVGDGPITDKGHVTKSETEITSADILTLEAAPCINRPVYMYSMTVGADGKIFDGFTSENLDVPTSKK